jgi:hypothetical protein
MRRNFSSLPQRLHRAMHMGGVAADLRRPGGRQHGRSPRRRSGIAFLIGWGASTVNALWGRGFDLQPVRGVVMSFAGVLIAAGLFGSIRLNFLAPSSPTVVAATVTIDRAVHDRAIGPPFDWVTFNRSTGAGRAVRPREDSEFGARQQTDSQMAAK